MDEINWDTRLIGIRGARGVGKTTMLLQHIKETHGTNPAVALYASLDPFLYQPAFGLVLQIPAFVAYISHSVTLQFLNHGSWFSQQSQEEIRLDGTNHTLFSQSPRKRS